MIYVLDEITCDSAGMLETLLIIKSLLNVISVVAPILLVISVMITIVKAITRADIELRMIWKPLVGKIVAAFVVFLLPTIVNLAMDVIGGIKLTESNCWQEATKENVQLKELEKQNSLKTEEIERTEQLSAEVTESLKQAQQQELKIDPDSSKTSSDKVQAYLDALEEISKKVQEKPYTWFYSNTNPSASGTYAKALKNEHYVTNCAKYTSWGLQMAGVLSGSHAFWKKGNNTIGWSSSEAKKDVEENMIILKLDNPQTPAQLLKRNDEYKLQPGDTIGWYNMQHTNAFAGVNEKGEGLFYDAGRGHSGVRCNNGDLNQCYFKTLGPVKTSYFKNTKVLYIFRIKT